MLETDEQKHNRRSGRLVWHENELIETGERCWEAYSSDYWVFVEPIKNSKWIGFNWAVSAISGKYQECRTEKEAKELAEKFFKEWSNKK